jgi:hypothetical protein
MLFPNMTYDGLALYKNKAAHSLDMLGRPIIKDGPYFPFEWELLTKLLEEWEKGTKDALKKILEILTGDMALDEKTALQVIDALEERLGPGFGAVVKADMEDLLDKSYVQGKKEIIEPKQITFNMAPIDQAAIVWLQQHNMFWIENYYSNTLSDLISSIVEKGLEEGLGRLDVAADLKDFFDGYPGVGNKPESYWNIVSSSGMSRSRHFGSVQGYVDAKIVNLVVMAVMDERTSEICREMNGRRIPVARAVEQRDQMMAAKDPEDVKAIAPWPKLEAIQGKSTEDIMAQGVRMPPYHGRCRTTVVEEK